MICPNCGRETSGKFCPACGTKLAVDPAPAAPAAAAPAYSAAPAGNPEPVASPNPAWQPNSSYQPNPGYPQQPGYQPNPGYGQQGAYNPGYANPGYVPSQGFNPGQQVVGGYQGVPAGAIGQTPASQCIRKLASSPVFLLAALFTTLAFGLTAYINVKSLISYFDWFDYYKGTSYESQLISAIATAISSMVLKLLYVLTLWVTFASAVNRNRERVSTAALTAYKVAAVLGLIGSILIFAVTAVVLVMFLASDEISSFMKEVVNTLSRLVSQAGYEFPDFGIDDLKTYICVFLGALVFIVLLLMLFLAKIIKSLNTGKRVIATGIPDDRVSVFVGVVALLGAAGNVYNGIRFIGLGGTGNVLGGVSFLLDAAATLFFAILLFQFRSGMRALGARNGIVRQ